ncbi:MAG: amino acid permease, partial [Bacteroidetes bacterium]|nr:amino acid permease [Bacteroidota bacterium]
WALTAVNSRGVRLSGQLQLVTTILKLLPLAIISIAGLFFVRAENFHPFNGTHDTIAGAITTAATMTMFSFVGIESATIPSGSVADPARTIPRATLLGLLIATAVYILSSVTVMGLIPSAQLQRSPTPFADAAETIFGHSSRYWISAGIAIAAVGALNGWTLVQSQMPYAISRDGLFPRLFTRTNSRGVPYAGLFVNSTIVSLLILMNYSKALVEQFRFLLLLSVFAMLVPYLFTTAAYVILNRNSAPPRKRTSFSVGLQGFLAFAYTLWEIAGAGSTAVFHGFILLMAAVPLYVWTRRERY